MGSNLADQAVCMLRGNPDMFTVHDVADVVHELAAQTGAEPTEVPNIGAALRRASQAGFILHVGMTRGRTQQAHARPVRLWRGIRGEADAL
jgi:hypothetical protein